MENYSTERENSSNACISNNPSELIPSKYPLYIQALFRSYITSKYFSYPISNLSNIPELLSSLSVFKLKFSPLLHPNILDGLEKYGMHFSYDQLSEISWKTCNTTTSVYYGELNDKGLPNGKGISINFTLIYEGEWEAGKRHGFGRLIGLKGIYTGDLASNTKSGKGKFIYPSGHTYIGDFLRNKRHGFGIVNSKTQHIEAEYKDGKLNGYGKIISKDVEYEGYFLNDRFSGNGHAIYSSGNEYWGNFKDGIFCGKGVLKSKKTEWFVEGEFQNFKKNGFFIHIHPNGGVMQNFYMNDKPIGIYIHYMEAASFMEKGFFIDEASYCHMNGITKFIYLGDAVAANDEFWLNYVGIKAIVSVLDNDCVRKHPEIAYLDVNIKDNESENIIQYIPSISKFISDWKSKGQNIFIHCKRGLSRGPAVLIGYYMIANKDNFQHAYEVVKKRHPWISLNKGFRNNCVKWKPCKLKNNN